MYTSMKVLVVDDGKAIHAVVAQCVNSLGHQLISVENGEQAVQFIKQNNIDLMLVDIEMPGIDGFETTRQIRAIDNLEWVPIIFLSSKQDDDSLTHAILAGGDAYLSKPINPLRLQLSITAMERIYIVRHKLHKARAELLLLNKELEKIALFDKLTGLANRRNFDETLEVQFKLAKRNKSPLSLIICNIDFFKNFNDTYGHQQGDACLAKVARGIGLIPDRPTDKACRYGGEEFTVILPNTDLQGVLQVAENIRKAVMDKKIPNEESNVSDFVTLSLGVVTYIGQFKLLDQLIKAADDALYRAKDLGRNRVESS